VDLLGRLQFFAQKKRIPGWEDAIDEGCIGTVGVMNGKNEFLNNSRFPQ